MMQDQKTIPSALLTYEERQRLSEVLNKKEPATAAEIKELKENFNHVTYVEIRGIISPNAAATLVAALSGNTSIKTLAFVERITDPVMQILSELLRKNRTQIKNFEVLFPAITQDGAVALADGLKGSTSLTSVHFGQNSHSSAHVFFALAKSLPFNKNIRSVHLEGKDTIPDQRITWITESLENNSCLEFVELRMQSIILDEIIAIFEALQFNTSTKHIALTTEEKLESKALPTFNNLYIAIRGLLAMNIARQPHRHPMALEVEAKTMLFPALSDKIIQYLPALERYQAYNPAQPPALTTQQAAPLITRR